MATFTVRIPIDGLGAADIMLRMGKDMVDRDFNVHRADSVHHDFIQSWMVEMNPDMGGRVELVIEVKESGF